MAWLSLATLGCLLATAVGEPTVDFTMCCPEGQVLKLVPPTTTRPWVGSRKMKSRETFVPKCVRSRRSPEDTLNGSGITIKDGEEGDKEMVISKTGTRLPSCPLALRVQLISLNCSISEDIQVNSTSNGTDVYKRVRLGDYSRDCRQSGPTCRKGNVYVDDKPVCDDDWDDDDAQVVCRELGFTDGGYATKESYFGKVSLETQSGWDQVRCSGRESSLLDCRHESFDDCGNSEGAGVVCYGSEDNDGGYPTSNYGRDPPPQPNYMDSYNYNGSSLESYSNSGDRYGSSNSEVASGSILLSSSGEITVPSNWEGGDPSTYKAGEFCLAGVWEGGPSAGVGEDQAVAVLCEPCHSEVLCSAVQELYSEATRNMHIPEIVADERDPGTKNMVQVADTNNDGAVSFDEFKAVFENYIGKVFKYIDSDDDGFLDEGVSIKSLNAKLFLAVVDETYLFVDVNQDDILSVDDAPPRTFRDKNKDGKISLREVFGVSLINLPAPLYRLYATLDRDKNEKISFEEAKNFIKGTLYVIDQNEDCSIDNDELIATLKNSKLPSEYQLAMKLLGDYYITLADYCLRKIVTAADTDGDEKTTLAELIGIKDPDVFYSLATVVERMGEPHRHTSEFLIGEGRRSSRDKRQEVQEMWLNVLYDFVDNRKYDSVPDNFCQLQLE